MASSLKICDRNQHIQVYVRCRPANHQEKDRSSPLVVEVSPESREVRVKERPGGKHKTFPFDRVFAPDSTQVDVYKAVAGPMIEEVLMGYNCTVFAYGQTGTGKTYTMQGGRSGDLYTWDTDPQSGIIPRVFHHLFDVLGQQDIEYNVRVSYLELYNEELFDLLGSLQETTKLRLYEDSTKKGSVVIQGLSEVIVHDKDEVYHILERGAERKRMAATQMNETSSRSHTIFSITVHIKESTLEGEDLVKIGKLNLVDLAGSECVGRSGAVDKRAREAGNINQSLLTLGRVITALVEKAPHVPYRESKLTRLLQDSLGGRTKTSIIATISPALLNLEETNSTLEYAHRAKNITNKPEVNQKMTKRALIKEYTEEIERLRRDLVASREKNGIFVDVDNYNEMRSMLSNQSEAIKNRLADIEALQEQKQKLEGLFQETRQKLEERNRELRLTQQNLDRTSKQLKDKDRDLKVTEFQREAQRHLVSVQARTEMTLKSQAQTLLQVASATTMDLDGLFCKLDRKSHVETTNQRVVKEFRNSVHGRIEVLEDGLCGMFNSYKQQLTSLKEQLEMNAKDVVDQTEKQTSFLDLLTSSNNNYASSTQQALTDVQETSGNKLEEMSSFKSSSLDSSLAKIVFLEERNKTLEETVMRLCQSQTQQMEELCLKMTTGFSTLSSAFKTVGQVLEDELEKLVVFFAETETSCKESAERKKESLQAIMNSLIQYKLEEEQEDEKKQERLKQKTESLVSSLGDLKSKSGSEYQSRVLSLNSSCIELSSEANNSLASNTLVVQDLVMESKTHLQGLEEQLRDSCKDEQNMVAAFGRALHADVHNIASTLQEHQDASSSLLVASIQATSEHRRMTQEAALEQREMLEGLDQWSREGRSLLSSRLDALQESATDFVDKEMKVDFPTGLTPQRKDYLFPRYLASTAPHQQILDQFRRTMDDSAALSVDIPQSPIKIKEELPVLKLDEADCPSDTSEASTSSDDRRAAQFSAETKENEPHRKVRLHKLGAMAKTKSGAPKSLLRSPN